MPNQRITFVDTAKGFCILFIVVGHILAHIGMDPSLVGFANITRMPLFFVLSGIFFNEKKDFFTFLIRKVNTLLIPFLFFYLMAYAIFYSIEWIIPGLIKTEATGILDVFMQKPAFNGPIWFLLGLFWVNIIFISITHIFKRQILHFLSVLFLGGIGYCCSVESIFLPCYLDSSLTALPFFYIGYVLKGTPVLQSNKLDKYIWIFIALSYFIAYSMNELGGHVNVDFWSNVFIGNYFIVFVVALFSVIAMLLLFKNFPKVPFLTYFGRYSIVPLCFHHLVYRPIMLVMKPYGEEGMIITAILTVLVCWALIPICIKVIPHFIGIKELIKIQK